MTPAATGRRETRDGTDHIVFTRTFRAAIDDVWAAVTESERLARWIGTWIGDPASGAVTFQMNAEGDIPEETFEIASCEAPRRLVIDSWNEAEQVTWHIELSLAEEAGVTTLTFSHSVPRAELASGVGPGWDYYLDRLVAAENGAGVGSIDWASYSPALSEHYRTLFS